MKNTRALSRRMIAGASITALAAALAVGGSSAAQADDRGGYAASDSSGSTTRPAAGSRGPLASLVTAGTITSAQATSVHTALHAAREDNHAAHEAQMEADRAAALKTLVSKGTLTQAQADAIAAADRGGMRTLISDGTVTLAQMQALHDELETLRDAHQATMEAERKAEQAKVLADLVSKGTITSAQSTAIATALADAPMGGKGGHMGGKGGFGRR